MVMIEVYIDIRPATLLLITMVNYTFSTQGYLEMRFLGVCKEKISNTVIKYVSYIHIKSIINILMQACHHTLIQAYHNTLFYRVHIALLLLFMHLMELHTICIYHP